MWPWLHISFCMTLESLMYLLLYGTTPSLKKFKPCPKSKKQKQKRKQQLANPTNPYFIPKRTKTTDQMLHLRHFTIYIYWSKLMMEVLQQKADLPSREVKMGRYLPITSASKN